MKTYYDILGISKNANQDDIKSAYRKLAREHHPDKGGDKEKFQQIQEAYEHLIDPQKRNTYDNGSSHSSTQSTFHTHFSFMHPQHQQQYKKNDHMYECNISLRDVFYGTTRKIKATRKMYCKNCNMLCHSCHGNGRIRNKIHLGVFTQIIEHLCNECQGSGKNSNPNNCNVCNNNRNIVEEKIFEINIPKGIENGETFTFHEWGEQSTNTNEISGNLIIKIVIEKHPYFTRQGNDLIYNCNITFVESIIGKIIVINNFDSKNEINTLGFGIINPFKEYTLLEKGLYSKNNERGNLKIRFNISYPDKSLSPENVVELKNIFDKINL